MATSREHFVPDSMRAVAAVKVAVAIALAYVYKLDNGEDIDEPIIDVPKDMIFNEDGTQ